MSKRLLSRPFKSEKSTVQPRTLPTWADRLGLCLSVACLIHCLATPVLLILLPSLSIFGSEIAIGHSHDHGHETLHEILLVILPIVALLAFIPGYRLHRNAKVFVWGAPGVAALAAGVYLSHSQHVVSTLITIFGSLLLVRAHLLNRKECACCPTHPRLDLKIQRKLSDARI